MAVPEIDPRDVRRMADMHAVYRMRDATDRLLYIGRTADAGRRFGDHSMKRWFPLVETIRLEWFPTEAAAILAERRAIQREHPRYNIAETAKAGRTMSRATERREPSHARHTRKARKVSAPLRTVRPKVPAPTAADAFPASRDDLLSLLSAEGGMTIAIVAAHLDVSFWTARVWLTQLRDEGLATVSGYGRGARWHKTRSDAP